MKKLLLPLIILLLIIGYFMSQKSHDSVDDAYDKMEKPGTESTKPGTDPGTAPDYSTPPDRDSDPTMPQESDDVAPSTPDPQSSESLIDATKDAARDTGDVIKDAARDTGDAVKDAADDAGDALKDAGDATKDAAEDAMDKLREEKDKIEGEPQE